MIHATQCSIMPRRAARKDAPLLALAGELCAVNERIHGFGQVAQLPPCGGAVLHAVRLQQRHQTVLVRQLRVGKERARVRVSAAAALND